MGELIGQNGNNPVVNHQEIDAVFSRMRADIKLPSHSGFRNRFSDVIEQQSILDKIQYPDRLPDYMTGNLLRQGDLLVAWRMVELISAYQRHTRGIPLPDNPQSFFSLLEQANDWTFRRAGVTRQEMTATSSNFQRATDILEGRTPSLWLFAETLDITETACGLTDPRKIDRLVRSHFTSYSIPQSIFKGTTVGYLLAEIIRSYFHPDTVQSLKAIAEQESKILVEGGLDLDGTFKDL